MKFALKFTLLTAIDESVATARPVNVAISTASVDEAVDLMEAVTFIRHRFDDVDWDIFPNRITIFGDDASVPVADDGDGDEGHFVLHLVFPVTPANPYAE